MTVKARGYIIYRTDAVIGAGCTWPITKRNARKWLRTHKGWDGWFLRPLPGGQGEIAGQLYYPARNALRDACRHL